MHLTFQYFAPKFGCLLVLVILFCNISNLVIVQAYDEELDTIVTIPKLGSIQGKILETAWSNREVLQFVDVKYAEPPTGEHRFKVDLCNAVALLQSKRLGKETRYLFCYENALSPMLQH